jgi:uncharacterized membrane protein YgdD (TMEM256/DUF423 family)
MQSTVKRPLLVTIVGLIFILTGAAGVTLHATEIKLQEQPFHNDAVYALLVSVLALVCGIYLLLRRNWARWIAVAWLVFHVVLSAFHSPRELLIHSALLVVLTYLLFRASSSTYFRAGTMQTS